MSVAIVLWKVLHFENFIFKKKAIINKKLSLIASFSSLFRFHNIRNAKLALKHCYLFLLLYNNSYCCYYAVNERAPIRLLLYTWCFLSIILFNAYSSTLISYLMTPRYHTMIESVEDIVDMKRPVFMVSKYSSNEAAVLVYKFH